MALIAVTPFLNTSPGARLTVTPKNGAGDVVPATVTWAAGIGASRITLAVAPDTLSCEVAPVAGQSGGVTVVASVGAGTFNIALVSGQVASLNGTFVLL